MEENYPHPDTVDRRFCRRFCAAWHEIRDGQGQPVGRGWCGCEFTKLLCAWTLDEIDKGLWEAGLKKTA